MESIDQKDKAAAYLESLYGLEFTGDSEAVNKDHPQLKPVIAGINKLIGFRGVCAKYLKSGDVAWKCLDCQKHNSSIICKECFDNSDHTGHRVQLKRNVGGCCDCGNPDDWDPNNYCTNHQGFNQDMTDIKSHLPPEIYQAADQVFTAVCNDIKEHCLQL